MSATISREEERNSFIKEKLEELELLTKFMDVPVYKRRNTVWLKDNLRVRNSSHPDYPKVQEIVTSLLQLGVRAG